METKLDYKRAWEVVRAVIHEWDPYALLATGAPEDEFDSEIRSVVSQIPRIKTANDSAHAISRVFSSAFQPEGFSPKECAEVGNKLFEAVKQNGLIQTGA